MFVAGFPDRGDVSKENQFGGDRRLEVLNQIAHASIVMPPWFNLRHIDRIVLQPGQRTMLCGVCCFLEL